MSSLLYSRYIPPSYAKVAPQHASTSTLAAPEATPSSLQNAPLGPTSIEQDSSQQASTSLTLSLPAKLLKRKRKKDDHLLDGQQPRPKRTKAHKLLLLKRDKSVNKAERLIESISTELEEKTVLEPTTVFQDTMDLEETTEVHPLRPLPQPRRVSMDPDKTTQLPLPAWLASPINVSATTTAPFRDLGIPDAVCKYLETQGFHHAFAVQVALLQLLALGDRQERGDVLVSAATGCGKTLGYLLPMISEMSKMSLARLRCVIVVPTRELTEQVAAVCDKATRAFAANHQRRVKFEVASANSYVNEWPYMARTLTPMSPWIYADKTENEFCDPDSERNRGYRNISSHPTKGSRDQCRADILIATPGRLVQMLLGGAVNLDLVTWVVLDESDRLLRQSYQQFVNILGVSLSKGKDRQITKVILSATLTTDLEQLNSLKLRKPKLVIVGGTGESSVTRNGDIQTNSNAIYSLAPSLIEVGIRVKTASEKPLQLIAMLREIGGKSTASRLGKGAVLVFTRTNEAAVRLKCLISLLEPTIPVGTITSIIPTSLRKKTLRDLKTEKLSIMIASDLASRGLDIPSLRCVINYDMPANLETYIHRVGRTARAGKDGYAYTLFEGTFECSQWKTIVNSTSFTGGRNVTTEEASSEWGVEFIDRYQGALKILAQRVGRA